MIPSKINPLPARLMERKELGYKIIEWKLQLASAINTLPGQFVNVTVNESFDPLLPRPFGVANLEGTILTLIFQIVGKGTMLMASLPVGSEINILMPLGNSFPPSSQSADTLVFLVGGIGLPPLLYYLYYYRNQLPEKVYFFYGAQKAEQLVKIDELQKFPLELILCTDTPSEWYQGRVTERFKQELPVMSGGITVLSCGPNAMLYALQTMIRDRNNIQAWASLETKMACGIGICNGCVCKSRREEKSIYQKICTDGPVFNLRDIIWTD